MVDGSNLSGTDCSLPETKGVLSEDNHGCSGWVVDVSGAERAQHLGCATIGEGAVGGGWEGVGTMYGVIPRRKQNDDDLSQNMIETRHKRETYTYTWYRSFRLLYQRMHGAGWSDCFPLLSLMPCFAFPRRQLCIRSTRKSAYLDIPLANHHIPGEVLPAHARDRVAACSTRRYGDIEHAGWVRWRATSCLEICRDRI